MQFTNERHPGVSRSIPKKRKAIHGRFGGHVDIGCVVVVSRSGTVEEFVAVNYAFGIEDGLAGEESLQV